MRAAAEALADGADTSEIDCTLAWSRPCAYIPKPNQP
jgi:hypothetical protein